MSQMRRLRDLCCSRATQRNSARWFKSLLHGCGALVVVAATVLLVLRFAVTPDVKAYVEDARLNSFAFINTQAGAATTSFFAYNISISVALTVCNLNRAMVIKYTKPLVAAFLFFDRRLYNVTVVDEGHKHMPLEREVHLLRTGGEVPYVLDAAAVEELKKQNATGVIQVEMRLSGEITLGIGNNRKLDLSCPLTLRRPPSGPDIVMFHEINCKPDKPKKIVF